MKAEPECRCKRLKCELALMNLHGRDFLHLFVKINNILLTVF